MALTLTRRGLLKASAGLGVIGTAGCLSGPESGEDSRTIEGPDRTTVGDPLGVRVTGFDPGASLEVTAAATDALDRSFEGSLLVQADSDGRAALSRAAVRSGPSAATWYGPDRGRDVRKRAATRMVLDRLSASGPSPSPPTFVLGDQRTVELEFQAARRAGGERTARSVHSRVLRAGDVTRQPVEQEELVGWLYRASTAGRQPGVVVLHGALAAVPHRLSELLATHGYATLALQYIDAPGVADSLRRVPLEYFDRAVRWLTDRSDVRDSWIGLVGVSRGAEAALLTAARYDGRTAVVCYHGGGVVAPGVEGVPPESFLDVPAWVRDGDPVADPESVRTVFEAVRDGYRPRCEPGTVTDAIRSGFSDRTLEEVLVPVEMIDGPVLLIAGGDDRQWPTIPVASLTVDQFGSGRQSPYGLRAYCAAGHVFAVPYADYRGPPTSAANGGTPEANARAAADAWPLVVDYLATGR